MSLKTRTQAIPAAAAPEDTPKGVPLPMWHGSSNTQWVFIPEPEPWHKRLRWDTLKRALRMLFTPEGWWRMIEALAALSEVNLDVRQEANQPYTTVTLHHRVTRSRFSLRGDGNLGIYSNRHVTINGVAVLENCSDRFDRDLPAMLAEERKRAYAQAEREGQV